MEIIIADSHYLIREGIRCVLKDEESLTITGEAATIEELRELLLIKQPDLILMDYNDPAFSYDDLKATLKGKAVKILAISPFQSKNNLVRGIDLGVSSFLLKSCDKQEIIEAIYATGNEQNFFCGQILEQILKDSDNEPSGEMIDEIYRSCEPVKITDREVDIIRLIAKGLTNNQIADQLYLSVHTVVSHRKNIMKKLGITNTAGIVIYAVKENIIEPR